MNTEIEIKREYQEPTVSFVAVERIWCNGSLDPIQGNNETPLIFI